MLPKVESNGKRRGQIRFHRRPDPKDRGIGAWDEDSVRELGDVKGEFRKTGPKIHHERIAELCTRKNSELPDGHEAKIYKRRRTCLVTMLRAMNRKGRLFSDLGIMFGAVSCLVLTAKGTSRRGDLGLFAGAPMAKRMDQQV